MYMTKIALGFFAIAGLSASVLAAVPVKVTRFHLDGALTPGPVRIESANAPGTRELEDAIYLDAVRRHIIALGFTVAGLETTAPATATVAVSRSTRPLPPSRPPLTIGIGGGGFGGGGFGGGAGGGVGGGGGASFGVGGKRDRELVITDMTVLLRRLPGGDVVWEGRASIQSDSRKPEAQATIAADKLARALFKGFPGESGRTITVK